MKKKGHRPITKVKNPEPKMDDPDWIIWATVQPKSRFCPNFSIGFQVNIIIIFHNGYVLTENIPANVYR